MSPYYSSPCPSLIYDLSSFVLRTKGDTLSVINSRPLPPLMLAFRLWVHGYQKYGPSQLSAGAIRFVDFCAVFVALGEIVAG